MSTTPVPMSYPATVSKNSDGSYTVRVQHTAEGSVTNVDFTNPVFGKALADAYAAFLNGAAVIDAKVDQILADAKPVADATADVKKLIAEAEVEASKLITAAKAEAKSVLAEGKVEASKLKVDAQAIYDKTKNEAEKLLADAKVEAAKLLHEVATKIDPSPTPAPAVKAAVEDEE